MEEVADSTLCLILNLYRRTFWLANMVSAAAAPVSSFGVIAASMPKDNLGYDHLISHRVEEGGE